MWPSPRSPFLWVGATQTQVSPQKACVILLDPNHVHLVKDEMPDALRFASIHPRFEHATTFHSAPRVALAFPSQSFPVMPKRADIFEVGGNRGFSCVAHCLSSSFSLFLILSRITIARLRPGRSSAGHPEYMKLRMARMASLRQTRLIWSNVP